MAAQRAEVARAVRKGGWRANLGNSRVHRCRFSWRINGRCDSIGDPAGSSYPAAELPGSRATLRPMPGRSRRAASL
jgi:hypothetical protein